MLYRDGGAGWLDETAPVDRYRLSEGNLSAEDSVSRFSESGGTGVVLRFGWFYGPGAAHSEQLLALARRHVCVQMGHGDGYVSSIHMADAGTAVAAALGVPAGIYNVVDDEPMTKRGYARALAGAARSTGGWRFQESRPCCWEETSHSLTRSVRASNEKLRRSADWSPCYRSAREGWAATAAELPAH